MSTRNKKLIYIIITILHIFFILYLKGIYVRTGMHYFLCININSILGWILLIWSLKSWQKLSSQLVSLYSVYLLLLYMFTYGQSLLIVFNLVNSDYNLLSKITLTELINAQIYTLLSLATFHIGAILLYKDSTKECDIIYNGYSPNENTYMILSIRKAGFILLAFSFPGFTYDTIKTINTVIQGGYGAIYGYQTGGVAREGLIVRIFLETAKYFVPALICLLISYRNNRKARFWILLIMAINIINGLYIGGRSQAVILILGIILIYHYTIEPIKFKSALKIGIFSYFIISFLSTISSLRGSSGRGILDYFNAFIGSFGEENLFFQAISEIGGTMFPLVAVMRLFPRYFNFMHFKSYFYALTAIIPNLGFWDIHPAKLYAGGGQWLIDTLNLTSGPGFTLIADAFRSFGWNGFFILSGFGALFGRIYSSVSVSTINTKPEKICMVMIFFVATLMSIRGDNLSIIRPSFYVVLPVYLIIRLIYQICASKKVA